MGFVLRWHCASATRDNRLQSRADMSGSGLPTSSARYFARSGIPGSLGFEWLSYQIRYRLSIDDDWPALKPHIDLLPSSPNRCLDSGLLRCKGIRYVELRLGHAKRIMFLDGELRREPAIS